MVLVRIVALLVGSLLCTVALAQTKPPSSDLKETIVTRGVSVGFGLKLDIYAPFVTKKRGLFKPGRKVPVLIYVHGGGWIKGSREKVYNLPQFATSRNWMLVSLDYRPGAKKPILTVR